MRKQNHPNWLCSRVRGLLFLIRSLQSVRLRGMELWELILLLRIKGWLEITMRTEFPSSSTSQNHPTEKTRTGQNAPSLAFTMGMEAMLVQSSWEISFIILLSSRIVSHLIQKKPLWRDSKRLKKRSWRCAKAEMNLETLQSLTGLAAVPL